MVEGKNRAWFNASTTFFFVLLVVACGSVGGDKKQRAEQESVDAPGVGTSESSRALKPGASFAWLNRAEQFYDAPRFKGDSVETVLKDTIVDVLTAKGFRFTPSSNQSDFLVGYTVILGEPVSDAEIDAMYEVEPELKSVRSNSKSYEHGTLVIKVFNPGVWRSIWSGSYEGYASLELPDEVRKRRLRVLVEEVLATFPEAAR